MHAQENLPEAASLIRVCISSPCLLSPWHLPEAGRTPAAPSQQILATKKPNYAPILARMGPSKQLQPSEALQTVAVPQEKPSPAFPCPDSPLFPFT